jgi:hypothetical protein
MSRTSDLIVAVVGLTIAIAFGLSYGDGGSNHPTYLPPGLRLVDPSLLAHDWWATHVTHYHWAFTTLVAALTTIGFLQWGMATLNVLSIGAFLWLLWHLSQRLTEGNKTVALIVWACAAYFVAATDGISSVADSFLFTPGLQPSTIAAVATLAALLFLMERRLVLAGLALAIGGLFHVNFLILNIMCFSLAHLIWGILDRARVLPLVIDGARVQALSLLLVAVSLPLIVGVAIGDVSRADLADTVVHKFALPFHYDPTTYLPTFWSLAGWQLLGLTWTRAAVPDPVTRRFWWAIQLSLITIIWTAAFLTTAVYVKQVVQLFVWRLAPLSELIAVLLLTTGVCRTLNAREAAPSWVVLGVTAFAVTAVARTVQWKFGLTTPKGVSLLILPAGALAAALARRLLPVAWSRQWLGKEILAVVFAGVVGALAVAALYDVRRFNLVATTPAQVDEDELYAWALTKTPANEQFVVPPDLAGFRLFARRAIVVDLKAVPYETPSVLEWYRRLQSISGVTGPHAMKDVIVGYQRLDAQRLDHLHAKYAVNYAVVRTGDAALGPTWVEVFRNTSFAVFQRALHRPQALPTHSQASQTEPKPVGLR